MRMQSVRTHLPRVSWLTAAVTIVGCSGPTLPSWPPDIVGVVQAVQPRILVVEQVSTNPDAILFSTDAHTTVIVRAPDGAATRGSVADIAIGSTVRAWSEGPVLDSYPAQAYGQAFEIL
jgi:Protein of unknown function (DUF3221)